MRNLLIALALIVAPTVAHAQAMRFPAANAGGGGGGGGCSTGGCSMTGNINFAVGTGVCVDGEALQCMVGSTDGFTWSDSTGALMMSYDLVAGLFADGNISTNGALSVQLNTNLNGDVDLGDASADTVTINGTTSILAETTITPGVGHAGNALLVTGGTLASGQESMEVTGTLPNSAGTQVGSRLTISTTAGSTPTAVVGLSMSLAAGSTASGLNRGLNVGNAVAGTGASLIGSGVGNVGIQGSASGAGAGHNAALFGDGTGSTARNYGVIGRVPTTASTDAVGVLGFASAGTTRAGVVGQINSAPEEPLNAGAIPLAGGVFSNGDVAAPIVLFLDDGTERARFDDGGSLLFTGVTADVTAASGEDLRLQGGASTGSVQIMSLDDLTEILSSGGGANAFIGTSAAGTASATFHGNSSSAGIFKVRGAATTQAILGAQNNKTATQVVVSIADSVSTTSDGTSLWQIFGSGLVVEPQRAQTCADSGSGSPGTLTIDIDASYIQITNSDVDGCTITISETSAVTGAKADLIVVSNAGGNVVVSNQAGVIALSASPYNMTLTDSLSVRYSSVLNAWTETSRSVN